MILRVIAVLAILAVVAMYAFVTARRLDGLHTRVDAAAAGLDGQLRRRSHVAAGLGDTAGVDRQLLDELTAAATAALGVPGLGRDRERVESALSGATTAIASVRPDVFQDSAFQAGAGFAVLLDAAVRSTIARTFFNDRVRDALVVRDRRIIRWLRLAGSAPHPAYFEMVDGELPVVAAPEQARRRIGV